MVVVIPVAPRVIAAVLEVPIEIEPLVVVPLPALILTEPPVEVVPDSLPALRVKLPPVPELVALVAGATVRELPPVKVVISGERFPARAS